MKQITRKVVSYCEIPEELTENHHISEYQCDCYIEMEITPKSEQPKYSDNFNIVNWIINTYPELEGEKILIEIDY